MAAGVGAPIPIPSNRSTLPCYRAPSPCSSVMCAADRSPSPDLRTINVSSPIPGSPMATAGAQPRSTFGVPRALSGPQVQGTSSFRNTISPYRTVLLSPDRRAAGWVQPEAIRSTAERDRSTSVESRVPLQPAPQFGSRFSFRGPLPVPLKPQSTTATARTASRRPVSPDSREPASRIVTQPSLPTPIRLTSRDQPTAPAPTSRLQPERLTSVDWRHSSPTYMLDTSRRLTTRSISPMQAAQPSVLSRAGQPPLQSRQATPLERSVSPSRTYFAACQPMTLTPSALRRTPSPCQRASGFESVRRQASPQPGDPGTVRRIVVSSYRQPSQPQRTALTPPLQTISQAQPSHEAGAVTSPQHAQPRSPKIAPDNTSAPVVATSPGACTSPAPLPANAELSAGAWLEIGGSLCQIKRPLGMGSFGAVWEAQRSCGGPTLAVKEILCQSHSDFLNALFEGHLLRSFATLQEEQKHGSASTLPKDAGCLLPSLVGHETSQLRPDLWRVRLAMTCLPGQPLDSFLRDWQKDLRTSPAADISKGLAEACTFARELLLQLAPAFQDFISGLSYHRDVNAHNILIDVEKPSNWPRYGLVDFGLAVDVQRWHCDQNQDTSRPSRVGADGASTWHHLDVGGDCRYWPVSAWVQFLLGWTELESNPVLRSEYRTRLDMHSLGLTTLQVLCDMMPPPDSNAMSGKAAGTSHSAGLEADAIRELYALQRAWDRYWSTVSPLHTRLMDTFHTGGDWDALKSDCLENAIHEAMATHLRGIRSSAVKARSACRRCQQRDGSARLNSDAVAGLLTALLLLIGSGDDSAEAEGMVGPGAVEVAGPVAWQEVRLALQEGVRKAERLSPPQPQARSQGYKSDRHADLRLSSGRAQDQSNGLSSVSTTATGCDFSKSAGVASQSLAGTSHQAQSAHEATSGPGARSGPRQPLEPDGDMMLLELSHLREQVDFLMRARRGDKTDTGVRAFSQGDRLGSQ
eukprot:TRINITY_DN56661_c0_g1_i1.p1 TRINITY_DN56661_c0_g1~~TRINITY_DN56661_c0_g1_i1.p1  ORF type:complete len:975 (-),score=110.77 TRINITY_DN56661_c0_g1_i1:137-3061(-)